jgi:NAD+ synthase (glutamine-hydrolysing)
VIGVSGGLDSTHALIVAARTLDRLGLPRSNLLAYSMPGFATSERTLRNARALMQALGVAAHELDVRPSAAQMLRDLRHPAARGEPTYDVTYENVQAGERTSHLFRLANYTTGWSSEPEISPSSRSAGALTAWATRCRTTTSTRPCPRR